jgi:hypothetical protein
LAVKRLIDEDLGAKVFKNDVLGDLIGLRLLLNRIIVLYIGDLWD